jgi:DNA repair protein RecO (recombination protein O)
VDKPRSSLAAGCRPFSHGEFLCWEGRSLDGVRQAQTIRSFRRLREELEAMAAASYVAELFDRLVQPEDPDKPLFGFLLTAFTLLEESAALELSVRYIEWQLLDRLGFCPVLDECVSCGNSLEVENGPWRLGLQSGGLLCSRCSRNSSGPRVSLGAVRTIARLLNLHPARLHVLQFSPEVRRELAGVGDDYLEYILERPLRSRDFMEELLEPQKDS